MILDFRFFPFWFLSLNLSQEFYLIVLLSVCNCFWVFLQFNSLLRDIFGLGPPIILDTAVKGNKISRFEKVKATFEVLFCTLEYSPRKQKQQYVSTVLLHAHLWVFFPAASF